MFLAAHGLMCQSFPACLLLAAAENPVRLFAAIWRGFRVIDRVMLDKFPQLGVIIEYRCNSTTVLLVALLMTFSP